MKTAEQIADETDGKEGLSNLKANGALILELTSRKHILTVTCEKCGDIKQFVNEI